MTLGLKKALYFFCVNINALQKMKKYIYGKYIFSLIEHVYNSSWLTEYTVICFEFVLALFYRTIKNTDSFLS